MKMACSKTTASVDHQKGFRGNKFVMLKHSRMISKNQPPKIRIIHIIPPQVIKTDAADFRNLVQRLTGRATEPTNTSNSKKFQIPQAYKDYQTIKSRSMTFSSFDNIQQYYPDKTLLLGSHRLSHPISSDIIALNREVSFGYTENSYGNGHQVTAMMVKAEEEEIAAEAATAAGPKWGMEQKIGSGFCSDDYTKEYDFPVTASMDFHWETDLFEDF